MSKSCKKEFIEKTLNQAIENGTLKDLGWRYNDCGDALFNTLSAKRQQEIAFPILQKAIETNTLKDLGWENNNCGYGCTLFNTLSTEKQQEIILPILQKAIKANTLKDLGWKYDDYYGHILFNRLPAEKQQEIIPPILQKAIETNTLKDLGWKYDDCGYALFNTLPAEKQQEIAFPILQKAIKANTLKDLGWKHGDCGYALFNALPAEKQQEIAFPLLQKAIETNTLKDLGWENNNCGCILFNRLPAEKKQEIALPLLQKAIETNTLKDLGWEYSDCGYGYILFNALPTEKQQEIALSILQKIIGTKTMINHNKDEIKMILYFLTLQNVDIKNTFMPYIMEILKYDFEQLTQVHYYNYYLEKYINAILDNNILQLFYTHPNMLETLYKIIDFTKQETEKGNIVLCHGQADQWAFLQSIYRKLITIKTHKQISDDFVALRFNNTTQLDFEHIKNLRENGIKSYNKDRFNILFTTIIPFQNDQGSNSYFYATKNFDQSTNRRYKGSIESIFKENGMKEEFEYIQKYNSILFDELEKLYKDANQEQGNYGNLICFSLPATLADKLAYPTHSGGAVHPIEINGIQETRISEIIQHFDQAGDWIEIALILAPEIIDPEKAQAAGVKIQYFGPTMTQGTEKIIKFEAKLNEIMELAKEHYNNRISHITVGQ